MPTRGRRRAVSDACTDAPFFPRLMRTRGWSILLEGMYKSLYNVYRRDRDMSQVPPEQTPYHASALLRVAD